jgi:hypothetical protein
VLNLVCTCRVRRCHVQSELEADYSASCWRTSSASTTCSRRHRCSRFGSTLVSKGTSLKAMQPLRGAYQPENLDTVMCRGMDSGLAGRPVPTATSMLGLNARVGDIQRPSPARLALTIR